ncbi:glycerate kinase type-2 family protein [Thiocystis violacea]|uniref:glycerate kinase type-2 family protein n=1 Tax=Thiocystis violacea TaxID=13725 RepID=UPI001F5BD9FE|nr:DUF4147 domain-containing protein [Thiocystis violacea]
MIALESVEGGRAVRRALAEHPIQGPVWLCAIGKAAESMTLGAVEALGDACVGGLLITKPGHTDPRRLRGTGLETLIGGHPVPDAGSLAAGARLLTAIERAPAEATLLFLVSGGASSLAEVPIAGLGLAELQRMNRWLLGSGLPIQAMNLIRKSVSRIKAGGLLSVLAERPVRLLAISDVPGDAVGVIGSGLLVAEPDLAERVGRLDLPDWLADWTRRGLAERGTGSGRGPVTELVATLAMAQSAVAAAAGSLGQPVWRHADLIQGDAADAGRRLARALLDGEPGLHIWGGETTVRLPKSPGRGGRNQHLALAAAIELAGHENVLLMSVGTDGTDGPTEDAGALVDGHSLERAELASLDALDGLARADAGRLLEASGDLIRTGPTGTNVMDLILGLKC